MKGLGILPKKEREQERPRKFLERARILQLIDET